MNGVATKFSEVLEEMKKSKQGPADFEWDLPDRYRLKILEIALNEAWHGGEYSLIFARLALPADNEIQPIFEIGKPSLKCMMKIEDLQGLKTLVRTWIAHKWESQVLPGDADTGPLEKFLDELLNPRNRDTLDWCGFDIRGPRALYGLVKLQTALHEEILDYLALKNKVTKFVNQSSVWEVRKAKLADLVIRGFKHIPRESLTGRRRASSQACGTRVHGWEREGLWLRLRSTTCRHRTSRNLSLSKVNNFIQVSRTK